MMSYFRGNFGSMTELLSRVRRFPQIAQGSTSQETTERKSPLLSCLSLAGKQQAYTLYQLQIRACPWFKSKRQDHYLLVTIYIRQSKLNRRWNGQRQSRIVKRGSTPQTELVRLQQCKVQNYSRYPLQVLWLHASRQRKRGRFDILHRGRLDTAGVLSLAYRLEYANLCRWKVSEGRRDRLSAIIP